MRTPIYICIIFVVFLAPLNRVNVSDLLPIEAVSMYVEDENVVIETDTGNVGVGKTVSEAVENLVDSTAAIVYLDTVKYLIVSTDARSFAAELKNKLKYSTDVYVGDITDSTKNTLAYLKAHNKLLDFDVQ